MGLVLERPVREEKRDGNCIVFAVGGLEFRVWVRPAVRPGRVRLECDAPREVGITRGELRPLPARAEPPAAEGGCPVSKPLHTPGPWVVDLEQRFTLGGDTVSVEALTADGKYVEREICNLMLDTDEHPDGPQWLEDCANARLIASAPDLLAAAEGVLAHLNARIAAAHQCGEPVPVFDGIADLYTAVAKAKGGA